MKHKIMEAILRADNDLSQEEISWAIQNIPNEGRSGRQYDHSKDNVFEACGYSKEDSTKIREELVKIKEKIDGRHSQFFEEVINTGSVDLHNFLIIRGLVELIKPDDDDDNPLDKLRKLLDKL